MYGSTTEEQRQMNEVRRLKRELHDARDQVMSLSSQLSTNVSKSFVVVKPLISGLFVMFLDFDHPKMKPQKIALRRSRQFLMT